MKGIKVSLLVSIAVAALADGPGLLSEARAGGGDWAPSIVCETPDHGTTIAWSYEQFGESLVGREFDIQLPGEVEGLPYLVASSQVQPRSNELLLALNARAGWADPGAGFPLGTNITIRLDQNWHSAELIARGGQVYSFSCGN